MTCSKKTFFLEKAEKKQTSEDIGILTMIIIMTFLCRADRAERGTGWALRSLAAERPGGQCRGVEFAVRSPGSERDGHGDFLWESHG